LHHSPQMRVLLVDTDAERASVLEASLRELGAVEILRPPETLDLGEAVAALSPDVVIVDMARPDRDGLDAIRALTASNPHPIVMFVDADDAAFMEEAIAAGVSSYNVLGATIPDVKPIVRTAVALFRRYRQIESELRAAKASIEDRSLVDRAKARLMQRRGLSENDAYRMLRRRAMDEGRRIVDIAAAILEC
jgi:two-component system, response regulator / RNA-binding antiterminator